MCCNVTDLTSVVDVEDPAVLDGMELDDLELVFGIDPGGYLELTSADSWVSENRGAGISLRKEIEFSPLVSESKPGGAFHLIAVLQRLSGRIDTDHSAAYDHLHGSFGA
jgi:hypothetical protein